MVIDKETVFPESAGTCTLHVGGSYFEGVSFLLADSHESSEYAISGAVVLAPTDAQKVVLSLHEPARLELADGRQIPISWHNYELLEVIDRPGESFHLLFDLLELPVDDHDISD